jgi:hypothetical protein
MTPLIAIVVGAVVVVAILYLVSRSRRANDGVDSFRRQIDALSPEARRPVIDQINKSPDRADPAIDPAIDSRLETRPVDPAGPGGADEADDGGGANEGGSDGA